MAGAWMETRLDASRSVCSRVATGWRGNDLTSYSLWQEGVGYLWQRYLMYRQQTDSIIHFLLVIEVGVPELSAVETVGQSLEEKERSDW